MAYFALSRHRAARLVASAAALAATLAMTAGTAPAKGGGIDWNAVGRAIGRPLETEAGDVHTAEWLRTDLHVVNAGVTENPGMELNAEASFHQTAPGRTVMIGEVTLTRDEVPKVADALQRGGVQITALHKHIQAETPRLWWMHYWALGDPVQIARAVHTALVQTGVPLSTKEEGKEPPVDLDVAAIDRIVGAKGEDVNGVLQYHIPVAQKITDTRAHVTLPYLMEASTLLMFQPLGGGRSGQRRFHHDRRSGQPGDQSPARPRHDDHRAAQPHAVRTAPPVLPAFLEDRRRHRPRPRPARRPRPGPRAPALRPSPSRLAAEDLAVSRTGSMRRRC
ncbi:hypothetical protein GCM10029978_059760 [Actinoallomurus acanthiterrae]